MSNKIFIMNILADDDSPRDNQNIINKNRVSGTQNIGYTTLDKNKFIPDTIQFNRNIPDIPEHLLNPNSTKNVENSKHNSKVIYILY